MRDSDSHLINLTWIDTQTGINRTQWEDETCIYTDVAYLDGSKSTRYAQCHNGSSLFYPGLTEPNVLYKESGYLYNRMSVYYANGTAEEFE